MDEWRKPLKKKELKREAAKIREAEKEPIKKQDPIIYVHSADVGVTIPAHPDKIFAVMRLKGLQYKVAKNDKILIE